jgi:transposase InsO family protein
MTALKDDNAVLEKGIWCLKPNQTPYFKIIVPECLKAFVIGCSHNIPLAGHCGARKAIRNASLHHYWKNLARDIRRWIRCCGCCGQRKTSRPIHAGVSEAVLSDHVNDVWSVDFVGPLFSSDNGNTYILTMSDCYSRWPEAEATPARSEEIVMEFIYNLICRRGRPNKILSDRGAELISKAVKRVCQKWGIRKIETGGYNAAANAIVERFHRYLLASLTLVYDRKTRNWDACIPASLFSYRVSVCDSTSFSPFLMESGRDPNLPASLNMIIGRYEDTNTYAQSVVTRLQDAWSAARRVQAEATLRNYSNRPRGYLVAFAVGSLVDIWMRASIEHYMVSDGEKVVIPRSLHFSWIGPYSIIEKVDDSHYVVQRNEKLKKFHVNRLRLHHTWDEVNKDTSKWYARVAKEGELAAPSAPKRILKEARKRQAHDDISPPQRKPIAPAPISTIALPVTKGQHIVWYRNGPRPSVGKDITPFLELPFGVGLVIDDSNQDNLICVYYGNSSLKPFGQYLPMWFQESENKYYWLNKRIHPSHPQWTTALMGEKVKASDAIFKSTPSSPLLDVHMHLTRAAKSALSAHPALNGSWGYKQEELAEFRS